MAPFRSEADTKTDGRLKVVDRTETRRARAYRRQEGCTSEGNDRIAQIEPYEYVRRQAVFQYASQVERKMSFVAEPLGKVTTTEVNHPRPSFDEDTYSVESLSDFHPKKCLGFTEVSRRVFGKMVRLGLKRDVRRQVVAEPPAHPGGLLVKFVQASLPSLKSLYIC